MVTQIIFPSQSVAGAPGEPGEPGPSPDFYEALDTLTANYTLDLADIGNLKLWNKAGTGDITIPPQVDVVWPDRCFINVLHIGATANYARILGGAGVTVDSGGATAAQPKSRMKGSGLQILRLAENSWFVWGDVV